MDKLKPCPFCEGEAELTNSNIYGSPIVVVRCTKCVEAVEEVHGRWAIDEEDIEWGNSLKKRYCTNCGKRPHFDKENREFILSEYCPACGAKMDGGDEK